MERIKIAAEKDELNRKRDEFNKEKLDFQQQKNREINFLLKTKKQIQLANNVASLNGTTIVGKGFVTH